MEQQIRFCTSTDGTQLAYATYGEGAGAPLLEVQGWGVSQQLYMAHPETRAYYEALAQGRRLITFDRRGSGASEREVDDFSLEAHVADVAAVVDHLQLERFDLFGLGDGAAVCCAYAAQHPERVSRLALSGLYARGEELGRPGALGSQVELIRGNWPLARRALASLLYPNGPPDSQQWLSNQLREAVSAEVAARYMEFIMSLDVTSLLPQVQAPTLVLTIHRGKVVPFGASRAAAALIPDARFVALEGEGGILVTHAQFPDLIRQFLDEGCAQPLPAEPGGLVTILFTDMESSTAITQRLGDAKAQELVRAHNAIVRDALNAHSGNEIKHTGDGIMASFGSALRGLECAVAIQQGVAAHNAKQDAEPVEAPLGVYIGLNAGEPIAEEEDLFGTSVDLAKRICDEAEPGQILASNVVRELAAGKGFLFADLGGTALRGFEDPVRLYEVSWREED